MQFSYTIFSFLAIATSLVGVSAQDTSGVPTCAYGCFVEAISSSGCSLADVVCQCTTGQAAIANAATPCILQSCSASEAAEVQPAAQSICAKHLASAGVTATGTNAAAATGSKSSSAATTAKTNAAAPKNAGGYVVAAAFVVGALAL